MRALGCTATRPRKPLKDGNVALGQSRTRTHRRRPLFVFIVSLRCNCSLGRGLLDSLDARLCLPPPAVDEFYAQTKQENQRRERSRDINITKHEKQLFPDLMGKHWLFCVLNTEQRP